MMIENRKIIITKCLKARNNLRKIISLTHSSQLNKLIERRRVFQSLDAFWDEKDELFEELHQKYQNLTKRIAGLRHSFKASIIYCPICGQINRNMIMFKGKWICTSCRRKIE